MAGLGLAYQSAGLSEQRLEGESHGLAGCGFRAVAFSLAARSLWEGLLLLPIGQEISPGQRSCTSLLTCLGWLSTTLIGEG